MYFSKAYYQYIPKSILEQVQMIDRVDELENDVLKVTLHRDPFNWNCEANLRYQRMFRDQLGIDQLAWTNGVGVLRQPYIEFAFANSSIYTVQYQNQYGQPVPKKQATQFVTRTLNTETKEQTTHCLVGCLNSQAYFPWVDDAGQSMMTYRLIQPELRIDKGVSAFVYYIRECLELNLKNDAHYDTYLSVLRFYVSEESLKNLPVEDIFSNLTDVQVTRRRSGKKRLAFDLKKGNNHLRVIFLDEKELQTSAIYQAQK
jgi:hypothetical protein